MICDSQDPDLGSSSSFLSLNKKKTAVRVKKVPEWPRNVVGETGKLQGDAYFVFGMTDWKIQHVILIFQVQPGYLREMLPSQAPKRGEPWDDIFKDIERAIMPGVSTHLYACALS